MPVHDELGIRMKEFYENIPKIKLMRRCPVCIRLDGKAFHTFTKGFKRPFDEVLIKSMQRTMKYLCENIQGCVFGYTQSDEITLILVDYKNLTSSAWFDYEVQKVCSIAASMATMAFNRFFSKEVCNFENNIRTDEEGCLNNEDYKLWATYNAAVDKGAMFDARCFNIPKEEVTNLIYWRQIDAARNSIQMVGQTYFNHEELNHKNVNMIQDMLFTQKGINWNDYPTHQKRGSCCIKEVYYPKPKEGLEDCPVDTSMARTRWVIDTEIPMFKNEGRQYVDKLVFIGE